MKMIITNPTFVREIVKLSKNRTVLCYDGITEVKLVEIPESTVKVVANCVFDRTINKYIIESIEAYTPESHFFYYSRRMKESVAYIESISELIPHYIDEEERALMYLAELHNFPKASSAVIRRISHNKYQCSRTFHGTCIEGDIKDLGKIYGILYKLGFDSYDKNNRSYKWIILDI